MSSPKSSKITVAVRVRPRNAREEELKALDLVEVTDGKVTVSRSLDNDTKSFHYDIAYSSESGTRSFGSQERVYNEIGVPILEGALEGINQCLFAYGQTGSGKSYTMTGYEDPGIIPRLTQDLFRRVSSSKGDIKVWVSYMEIYNEHIHDLLRADNSDEENLSIFEHQKLGVVVPDATVLAVASLEDVNRLMEQGLSRRVSASTLMNATSSRSHAIYTLHVETKSATSRINLIDLAGSERISKTNVTGENQREAAMINQSLTNLGLVIKALSEKKDFVPFRNSKLTFLLKDSLSGNSRTYMMANISPAETEMEETISTLRFASNVKRITTSPQVNYGTHEDLVNSLKSEIEELRAELAKKKMAESPDLNATLKVKAAVLRMVKSSISRKLEKDKNRKSLMTPSVSNSSYLMNVSHDPLASGPLSALLASGPLIIGSGEEDTVVISGEGTAPTMAVIERRSDSVFFQVRTVNVFLNNKAVIPDGNEHELSANDVIRFGSSCMYRLVVPGSGKVGLQPVVPGNLIAAAKKLQEKISKLGLPGTVRLAVCEESADLDEQLFVQVNRAEGFFEFYDIERFDRVFALVPPASKPAEPPSMAALIQQLEQLDNRVNLLHQHVKQLAVPR